MEEKRVMTKHKKFDRNDIARHKLAETKQKADMLKPENQYINAKDDKGDFKYQFTEEIRLYALSNPDPVLDVMRRINALVHEVRHHKLMAEKTLAQYNSIEPVTLLNRDGRPLDRKELYSYHVAESQTIHTTLSSLRSSILNLLLPKVDGDIFTFEQFDKYVNECKKVITNLGYDLFPTKVELIMPM